LPPDTVLDIRGHGWGHGRGMGQWGAKGMADDGNGYTDILDHYYRAGASTSGQGVLVSHGQRGNPLLRVLVEASQDVIVTSADIFEIRPFGATDLAWTSSAAKPFWRITYSNGEYKYSRAESWNPPQWEQVATDSRYAVFKPGDKMLELVRNGGSVRRYRGTITARWSSGDGMRAINNVRVEDYLRGVVPRESPASWPAAALRAQSVAARTYAHRYRDASRSGGNTFDICATTSCQVYEGNAGRDRPNGSLDSYEVTSTNQAIKATAGEVLLHNSDTILAEFSSSTGGYTAPGYVPYQVAVPDPGDRVSPHHDWSANIRVTEIESRWPSIGRLSRIEVTERNGYGDWGGRVKKLQLVGTNQILTITGDAFRSAFAWPSGGDVRSSWFTIGIVSAERAGFPSRTTIPNGSSKKVSVRYKNSGTDPWFVGGELQLETESGSPFKASDWISNTVVSRIDRNVQRPKASLVNPGETAEFVMTLDASSVAPGSYELPLRLQPSAGRIIDRITLNIDVASSWISDAANMLTSGTFDKAFRGWERNGFVIGDGRDASRGATTTRVGRNTLLQQISFAGGQARSFTVGGWSQNKLASSVLHADVAYQDGSSKRFTLRGWQGQGWQYAERGFRTDSTKQLASIRIRVVSDVQANGRADIDALRLLEDSIQNPSFEQSSLTGWQVSQPDSSVPIRRIDWAGSDGRSALRIPGRAEATSVTQRFPIDARAWDRLELAFTERVYGADLATEGWKVELIAELADGSETQVGVEIDPAQHTWRRQTLQLRPQKDVTHARIEISTQGQTGRADFDAFRLLRSRHQDPSFERDQTWSTGGLGSDDGFVAKAGRDGDRGLRITGPEPASVSQRLQMRGPAARTLRLSVLDAVIGPVGRGDVISVGVTFFHRDGSKNTVRVPLGTRAHPWTFREALVASKEPYDGVRLAVMSRSHEGSVLVDRVLLADS
jgi:stage II sporulation protein D